MPTLGIEQGSGPVDGAVAEALGLLTPTVRWTSLLPAIDASPEQVLILSGPDQLLAYQNPASAAALGARPLGIPAGRAFPDFPEWVASAFHVYHSQTVVRLEHAPITVTLAGQPEPTLLDILISPLLDQAGTVVGVLSQAVDVSVEHTEDQRVRLALALNRVSVELSRSLEVDQVTNAVTQLAAEVFEGWCLLDLFDSDGTFRRATIVHHDPAMAPMIARLREMPRVSGRALGRNESIAYTVARTGQVAAGRFQPGALAAAATSDEHAAIFRELRPDWFLAVPIQVGPRRLGALTVLRSAGEPAFTPIDRAVAEQFAERAAIALAHARDYDEQRQAVLTLQRSLLPGPPPDAAPAEVAVRYQAGGAGSEVGGDWYDVLTLGSGQLAVAVGDVQGHDLAAASLMSQIRAIVHAFATTGLPPGRIAGEANDFLASLATDRLVTFSYFEVHPAEHLVVWIRAGHVPAVVVEPDGTTTVLHGRGGLPLGVDPHASWPEETLHLAPGSLLAVFTDGLVESSTRGFTDGVETLAAVLRDCSGNDVEAIADEVLDRLSDADTPSEDDVALVLLRLPHVSSPTERRVVRRLPPAASSASVARQFLADLLAAWGLDAAAVETAKLLVSELIANATRHSDGLVELRVELTDGRLCVGVFDDSHRIPELLAPDVDASSGRGLQLVDMLADDWGIEREERGKCVWFAVTVGHDADAVSALDVDALPVACHP